MTPTPRADLARLADDHLDPTAAARWASLLRPAVRLVPVSSGEPVLARLGGTPHLPAGMGWPTWPGVGALSFVAELDLDALAGSGLDPGVALPGTGRLLAFYFDDPEGIGAIVYCGDPESRPGSRLVHAVGTPPTEGAPVLLTGRQVLTWPDTENPALERAGLAELPDAFVEALGELTEDENGPDVYGHLVGGWAQPVQGAVELEAAETRLGEATYDEAHDDEALRWRPLLQVDSDEAAGTSWGDAGCLYWLGRTDGAWPAEDDIAFTWQCG